MFAALERLNCPPPVRVRACDPPIAELTVTGFVELFVQIWSAFRVSVVVEIVTAPAPLATFNPPASSVKVVPNVPLAIDTAPVEARKFRLLISKFCVPSVVERLVAPLLAK